MTTSERDGATCIRCTGTGQETASAGSMTCRTCHGMGTTTPPAVEGAGTGRPTADEVLAELRFMAKHGNEECGHVCMRAVDVIDDLAWRANQWEQPTDTGGAKVVTVSDAMVEWSGTDRRRLAIFDDSVVVVNPHGISVEVETVEWEEVHRRLTAAQPSDAPHRARGCDALRRIEDDLDELCAFAGGAAVNPLSDAPKHMKAKWDEIVGKFAALGAGRAGEKP
jgi:hypothetical protein